LFGCVGLIVWLECDEELKQRGGSQPVFYILDRTTGAGQNRKVRRGIAGLARAHGKNKSDGVPNVQSVTITKWRGEFHSIRIAGL
jgi:hypothetical protein